MVPWSMVHDCIDRTIMDRLACISRFPVCYDLYDIPPAQRRGSRVSAYRYRAT
jgi:hypothetical protein